MAGVTGATVLEARGLGMEYPARGRTATASTVLSDVSFEMVRGEFVTVIGPSGCGKSTLLKCIAGLEDYQYGELLVDGVPVTGPSTECSVVFQAPSLLPWRRVLFNVEYGLRLRRGTPRDERRRRAEEALELVGLGGVASRFPHELSGGMQQRANLARALAVDPSLLLMDEPFGALDAMTREAMQDELVRIAQDRSRTTVFVTHDVEEAVFLGDRVIVMDRHPGRIAEIVPVELPRPRRRDVVESAEFQSIAGHLRELLFAAQRA